MNLNSIQTEPTMNLNSIQTEQPSYREAQTVSNLSLEQARHQLSFYNELIRDNETEIHLARKLLEKLFLPDSENHYILRKLSNANVRHIGRNHYMSITGHPNATIDNCMKISESELAEFEKMNYELMGLYSSTSLLSELRHIDETNILAYHELLRNRDLMLAHINTFYDIVEIRGQWRTNINEFTASTMENRT